MAAAAHQDVNAFTRHGERGRGQGAGRGIFVPDRFTRRRCMRVHDARSDGAEVALVIRNIADKDGPVPKGLSFSSPVCVGFMLKILEYRVGPVGSRRLPAGKRRAVQGREGVFPDNAVFAQGLPPGESEANRVFEPAEQVAGERCFSGITKRVGHDRGRQRGIRGIQRNKRGIRRQFHTDRTIVIFVGHFPDRVLPQEGDAAEALRIERAQAAVDPHAEILFEGIPPLRGRNVIRTIPHPDMPPLVMHPARGNSLRIVVSHVPVPNPAVTAEVDCSRKKSADRHSDMFEGRGVGIPLRFTARGEGPDPFGVQPLVGRDQACILVGHVGFGDPGGTIGPAGQHSGTYCQGTAHLDKLPSVYFIVHG